MTSNVRPLHSLVDEVLEQHKQMQGKSLLVKKLHSDLQELIQFSDTVSKDVRDIRACKVEDDQQEAEFQAKFGSRPASQVCAGMWKDLETYKGYHEQGVSGCGREGGGGGGGGHSIERGVAWKGLWHLEGYNMGH